MVATADPWANVLRVKPVVLIRVAMEPKRGRGKDCVYLLAPREVFSWNRQLLTVTEASLGRVNLKVPKSAPPLFRSTRTWSKTTRNESGEPWTEASMVTGPAPADFLWLLASMV